jgi:adenine C2-methylase RlmN of 23S rRNA A2503 and tRNA A37
MRRLEWIIPVGLLVLTGPALADQQGEQEAHEEGHQHQPVTLQQLPQRAQQELQRSAGGQKPERVSKETYPDGTVLYEAEYAQKGREVEYVFTPGGYLIARHAEAERGE